MRVPSTAPTTPGNLPIDWSLKLSMVSLIRTAILKHNKIIICYAPLQLTIKEKLGVSKLRQQPHSVANRGRPSVGGGFDSSHFIDF